MLHERGFAAHAAEHRGMSFEAALTYAERHDTAALAIVERGDLRIEHYGPKFDGDSPHALYSGTKSFWGIAAMAAAEDGFLTLDEPVATSITEWRGDDRKAAMTVRQLLNLTSGYGFGGLGAAVPPAAKALELPLKNEPGAVFTYGGIPLQVFGEVLRRKLGGAADEPHAYLRRRVLDPLGIAVASWRTLRDGTHPLPTGAFLDTHAWLRFGALLLGRGTANAATIIADAAFAECVRGSRANPRYGLGLWLDPLGDGSGIVYASGAGGQALYAVPHRELIAVRFGRSNSWRHEAFLRRLLG